jgi:hypothetical protein
MSLLTNFSNKTVWAFVLLFLLPTVGCVLLERQEKETLMFQGLVADKQGPFVTHSTTVRWIAETAGGVGDILYEFRTMQKGGAEYVEQKGTSSSWDWRPRYPGIYQVRVTCRDAAGSQVDSGWSKEYSATAPVGYGSFFTILPIENLSGVKVPVKMIDQAFRAALEQNNFQLLDQESLNQFMQKHRMRYTGGINYRISKALREEKGVDAVFITSLETYQEKGPPKISLFARLVLCAEPQPEILWMDSVGLTGEDSPGLLGIGRIPDMDRLLQKSVDLLLTSLKTYIVAEQQTHDNYPLAITQKTTPDDNKTVAIPGDPVFIREAMPVKKKYVPKTFYRSHEFDPDMFYAIAVVPFLNINTRKNAGEVVPLHFVNQLLRHRNFTVVEPGMVREEFLNNRLIMEEGPSLAVSDLISSSSSLGVDLVLSGKVFDYQGMEGIPKVDFSTLIIDGKRREIIWSSRSYGSGEDGVFFFDAGRVHSAHGLTQGMSGAVIHLLEE